jgi:hypothetical protein|nr:MAG TPA: hypothetical protein [Bacteriophage sp.]
MINIDELKKLNYEDGKALLLNTGYVAQGSGESPCYSTEAEKIIDEHFYLFDKDDEQVDLINYTILCNLSGEPNDEQGMEIVRAYWERIED